MQRALVEGVLGLDRSQDELRVEILLLAAKIVHMCDPIDDLLAVLFVLLLGRLENEETGRALDAYDVILVSLVVLASD